MAGGGGLFLAGGSSPPSYAIANPFSFPDNGAGFAVTAWLLVPSGSGVGKSVLVQRVLNELAKDGSWLNAQLNFSAQTSAGATQAMIEERLDKRRRTGLGPPPGKRLAVTTLTLDSRTSPAARVLILCSSPRVDSSSWMT